MVKDSACKAGDPGEAGSIPGSGRPPGEGNGNPLQYSHLENPMERGAWWAIIHTVAKSRTQTKRLSRYTHALKMEARRIGWERFMKEKKEDRMVLWKKNDSIVQAE